jgi:hypothetical protein
LHRFWRFSFVYRRIDKIRRGEYMSKKYKKMKNPEFTIFVENMVNQAEANKTTLEFDAAKITELNDNNILLKAKLLSIQNLQDTLDSEIQSIKMLRISMNGAVEKLEIDAGNNDKVSGSLIELLGFSVKNSNNGSSGVAVPMDLLVNGTSDGINHLKWSRNGNRQGTTFIIEAKIGDSNNWIIIDAVTNTKYDHKNQTPGVKVQYRIRAKRGDFETTASNMAVVYG